jgi:hypothetical protein
MSNLSECGTASNNGWAGEFVHNCRIRPDEQDIFDWLLEHKNILDMGADGMTMKETFEMLK